jgi:hypothetical protein
MPKHTVASSDNVSRLKVLLERGAAGSSPLEELEAAIPWWLFRRSDSNEFRRWRLRAGAPRSSATAR